MVALPQPLAGFWLPLLTRNPRDECRVAGATALIAVIGSQKVKDLGWMYVLVPALSGSVLLVAAAVLLNNLAGDRSYPKGWLGLAPTRLPRAESQHGKVASPRGVSVV